MARTVADRKVTNLLTLAGTALVSFIPLSLASFHGAIEEGSLLVIASVFTADGIFRSFSPNNKKMTNWSYAGGIACFVFALFIAGEYGPIASQQLRQSYAIEKYIYQGSDTRLAELKRDRLDAEKRMTETVRNDSVVFLIFSLLVDASVILWIED